MNTTSTEAADAEFELRRKALLDHARECKWPIWLDWNTCRDKIGKDIRNPAYSGRIPITHLGGRAGVMLDDLVDFVASASRAVSGK